MKLVVPGEWCVCGVCGGGRGCSAPLSSCRRLACLKYLVLANMLMKSGINPFDSTETKAYKGNPEVLAMTNLVRSVGGVCMVDSCVWWWGVPGGGVCLVVGVSGGGCG